MIIPAAELRDWLRKWLYVLEQEIPPRDGCHHALHFGQYGSDETGWRPELVLLMTRRDDPMMYPFFVDPADFDKPQSAFIADLLANWPQPEQPTAGPDADLNRPTANHQA